MQPFLSAGRHFYYYLITRDDRPYQYFREMLGDLETSVNSLEQGSKNMLTQARLLAAKQTAKSWLPTF